MSLMVMAFWNSGERAWNFLQPNETHLATFRALGANALSMDIKEVYSAMEQKVIDGHEIPYNLIYDSRFFEVQKFVSNTGHFFDFIAAFFVGC